MKKMLFLMLCIATAMFGANGLYRDGAKGVVVDTRTGLMWQDNAVGSTMNWATAITTCENLTLGGYADWRLPNINELKSIRDVSRSSPAIDTTFTNTASNDYWSSTTYAISTTLTWTVGFDNGLVSGAGKTNSNYVRCVRGN